MIAQRGAQIYTSFRKHDEGDQHPLTLEAEDHEEAEHELAEGQEEEQLDQGAHARELAEGQVDEQLHQSEQAEEHRRHTNTVAAEANTAIAVPEKSFRQPRGHGNRGIHGFGGARHD